MRRLTYRGGDLDALVKQIAGEHGPTARIVAIDKERTGGVMGFFQREEHVLVTEVADGEDATAEPGSVHGASAAAAAVAAEAVDAARQAEPVAATSPGRAGADAVSGEEPDPFGATARTIDELLALQAEDVEDVVELSAATRPPRSFSEALDAVTGSLGEHPAPMFADLEDPVAEWAELAIHQLQYEPPAARRETPDLDDQAANRGELVWQLRSAGYPARWLAELMALGSDGLSLERAFSIIPDARPYPSVLGSLIAVVGPAARALELAESLRSELQVEATSLALVRAPRRTPRSAPPRRRASTTTRAATDASVATARTPTVDDDPGARFGPGFVATDLEGVTDLSQGWRRDRVGVVVIEWDGAVTDLAWVRSALRAVSPNYVCLVARAAAKIEDLTGCAQSIGGADCLLLEGLAESMTPLSALGSGIPVARLDGRTATVGAWVGALAALPTPARRR